MSHLALVGSRLRSGLTLLAALWSLATQTAGIAAETGAGDPPSTNRVLTELNARSWFHGRDYFVLRSGRARLIAQADRADLGPAFTQLLFDAQNARQSARKTTAFNWDPDQGAAASALEVELGGFPFTALGHRTETSWGAFADNTPFVQATWWAGGIRVDEFLVALTGQNAFYRLIELQGAHLVSPETVTLRLRLPPGETTAIDHGVSGVRQGARLGLLALEGVEGTPRPERAALDLGPFQVEPGGWVRVPTLLAVEIPAGDAAAFAARVEELADEAMSGGLAGTVAAWRQGSRVRTEDALVSGLFDKARFGLAGMIADDGTMDAGIFEYGAQWVRDTSNTALGALHAGQFEITRAALVRMLTTMVNREGATMIANSFEQPDLEQFDQMGELLHLVKAYRDWTGDDALIRAHRDVLLAMIERPLHPQFRDDTGMVHNRREFWERTFEDAYELAYQTYVILGLRDAADLASTLGVPDRAPRWRAEAERIRQAVLSHPTRSLVREGALIKRRNVTGRVADDPAGFRGFAPDVPLRAETGHRLMPDASMALPLALGGVEARSAVGRQTLDRLEGLWNTRWTDGGYDRYHTSGQPDQPGPWPFATTFILRAQHEAGMWERSRRSLEWLDTHAGGRTGAWFEEIPSIRSIADRSGLVCWTSGEIALFVVRHYLGVRFEGEQLVIRPALYPGSPDVRADLRFRGGRLSFVVTGRNRVRDLQFDGRTLTIDARGNVRLPPL